MHEPKCQGPFRSVRKIVLASGSPRRRDLLGWLGLGFSVCTAQVEELDGRSMREPERLTMENAMLKLEASRRVCPGDVIICADTCVYCDGRILGKPADYHDALDMLSHLSGKWHQVYTSFVIRLEPDERTEAETVVSEVFIDSMDRKVMEAYCSTEEPYDKAGAYAVQGSGAFLVRGIRGSYTNVVGLPVTELVQRLLDLGAIEPCVNSSKG